MDHLCYLCLVFVMLKRLFIAALWSPDGKGLTSWLSFVMFNCVFVTFPCGILGQVWYLIVSIPYVCHLSSFPTIILIYKLNHHNNKSLLYFSMKNVVTNVLFAVASNGALVGEHSKTNPIPKSMPYGWSLKRYWNIPLSKIVSEYDQEIPQSQNADKNMAPRGKATPQP